MGCKNLVSKPINLIYIWDDCFTLFALKSLLKPSLFNFQFIFTNGIYPYMHIRYTYYNIDIQKGFCGFFGCMYCYKKFTVLTNSFFKKFLILFYSMLIDCKIDKRMPNYLSIKVYSLVWRFQEYFLLNLQLIMGH